eukprot:366212-Chlamydomonas_euryale.AAC.20
MSKSSSVERRLSARCFYAVVPYELPIRPTCPWHELFPTDQRMMPVILGTAPFLDRIVLLRCCTHAVGASRLRIAASRCKALSDEVQRGEQHACMLAIERGVYYRELLTRGAAETAWDERAALPLLCKQSFLK